MRYIIALLLLVSFATTVHALTLNENISETDGFEVYLEGSKITIINKTGADAFNVYVLVYDTEEGHPSFGLDSSEPRNIYIPVIPGGFKVVDKYNGLNDGPPASKYHARVYYMTEYTGVH